MSRCTVSNFWLIVSAKPPHIIEDTISWSTEEEGVPHDGDKIKILIDVPPSASVRSYFLCPTHGFYFIFLKFVNRSDAQLLFSLCLVHAPDQIVPLHLLLQCPLPTT
jgi:hypothetical protein